MLTATEKSKGVVWILSGLVTDVSMAIAHTTSTDGNILDAVVVLKEYLIHSEQSKFLGKLPVMHS